MSYRYSSCIFACAAKFLSAVGSGCAAMSNRAGSALAVPGVASISTGAHASACNTAMRTQQLFDLISPPKNCSSYAALWRTVCYHELPRSEIPPDDLSDTSTRHGEALPVQRLIKPYLAG